MRNKVIRISEGYWHKIRIKKGFRTLKCAFVVYSLGFQISNFSLYY